MTKTCKDCKKTKAFEEFYKHPGMADGCLNSCKECRRIYTAKRRYDNPDLLAERDRLRYQSNPARKLLCNNHAIANKVRHPLHRKARVEVNNAVRDGRLARKACEECGSQKSEAHHDDYLKPLDVIWLCRRHHMERHRKYTFLQRGEH